MAATAWSTSAGARLWPAASNITAACSTTLGARPLATTEARAIGHELQHLAPLLEGTQPKAASRLCWTTRAGGRWQIQPHNQLLRDTKPNDYCLQNPATVVDPDEHGRTQYMTGRAWLAWPFAAPYIALWERNIPVAFVAPDSDLSQYEPSARPS